MDSEEKFLIRHSLECCRRQGLLGFVKELMVLLDAENFTLADFLGALVEWADLQKTVSESVIDHLDKAASELQSNGDSPKRIAETL